MDEDKKDQNEKQRKSKELTATDRVAWAVKKEDLPPKKNTKHFGATKLPSEVKRLLQVMMPTVPLEKMRITAGPEEVRQSDKPVNNGEMQQKMYKAYRHTAIDAQAEMGNQGFKNWQGDTKTKGRGEPVFAPISGKVVRFDPVTNGLIIADDAGHAIGVRHMKLGRNPDAGLPWKEGDDVKPGQMLGFMDSAGVPKKEAYHLHFEVGKWDHKHGQLTLEDPYARDAKGFPSGSGEWAKWWYKEYNENKEANKNITAGSYELKDTAPVGPRERAALLEYHDRYRELGDERKKVYALKTAREEAAKAVKDKGDKATDADRQKAADAEKKYNAAKSQLDGKEKKLKEEAKDKIDAARKEDEKAAKRVKEEAEKANRTAAQSRVEEAEKKLKEAQKEKAEADEKVASAGSKGAKAAAEAIQKKADKKVGEAAASLEKAKERKAVADLTPEEAEKRKREVWNESIRKNVSGAAAEPNTQSPEPATGAQGKSEEQGEAEAPAAGSAGPPEAPKAESAPPAQPGTPTGQTPQPKADTVPSSKAPQAPAPTRPSAAVSSGTAGPKEQQGIWPTPDDLKRSGVKIPEGPIPANPQGTPGPSVAPRNPTVTPPIPRSDAEGQPPPETTNIEIDGLIRRGLEGVGIIKKTKPPSKPAAPLKKLNEAPPSGTSGPFSGVDEGLYNTSVGPATISDTSGSPGTVTLARYTPASTGVTSEDYTDTVAAIQQTLPEYDQASTALGTDQQPAKATSQKAENSDLGGIKFKDFCAALAVALADELERRGWDPDMAYGSLIGRAGTIDTASGTALQIDHGKQDEFRQQFAQGVNDFVAAVKVFADQQHEININIDESGTTSCGQLTRY